MKLSLKVLAIAISLPIVLTACSGVQDKPSINAEQLQHHQWQLTHINGQPLILDENYPSPTLTLDEEMMASGNAGCNQFFGQAELNNNRFRIERMGMTMKMCFGEVMDTEQLVSQSLTDWNDVIVTQETLTLKNDAHTLTYTRYDWVK